MRPHAIGGICALASLALAAPATAAVGPPVQASGLSPFAANCHGAPQNGTLYLNSEVEPWVDVNPETPSNLIGVFQQDRFETGGASGLGTTVSRDGGASWTRLPLAAEPKFSRCMGAAAGSAGDYERATDPWVSFGPDGDAYQISLSFNDTRNLDNAILVSESTDGGGTWGPVTVIRRDTAPTVFNDKESITADYTNGNLVYAIWDRLVSRTSARRARPSSPLRPSGGRRGSPAPRTAGRAGSRPARSSTPGRTIRRSATRSS